LEQPNTGYLLQEEERRLGGLTVRSAIALLAACDPAAAAILRTLDDTWLDRRVWIRGSGTRLSVDAERPLRNVVRTGGPWRFAIDTEWGTPYVQITME